MPMSRSPLPLCGDESCQSMAELDTAARRYDIINIKLDKCGGLTHALEMRARLRAFFIHQRSFQRPERI